MLGTVTNYLSSNTLGIAAPAMLKEIGFTEQQYSWITAAFNLAYPIGGVGGFTGTLLIGAAVASISYHLVFDVLGFLDLIGAALLWTLLRQPRPAPARDSAFIPGL